MLFENKSKIFELIEEYNLTLSQLFIIDLRYNNDNEGLCKYIDIFHSINYDDLEDLANKGLIKKESLSRIDKTVSFADIILTPKIISRIKTTYCSDCFEELLKIYPTFTIIGNERISLKGTGEHNKKHYSVNDLERFYLGYIKDDLEKHEKIIEITKLAKELGLLKFTFRRYLIDMCWKAYDIDELRELVQQDNHQSNSFMTHI